MEPTLDGQCQGDGSSGTGAQAPGWRPRPVGPERRLSRSRFPRSREQPALSVSPGRMPQETQPAESRGAHPHRQAGGGWARSSRGGGPRELPGAGARTRALTCGDVVANPLDRNAGVLDRLAELVHHHPFDAPVRLPGGEEGWVWPPSRAPSLPRAWGLSGLGHPSRCPLEPAAPLSGPRGPRLRSEGDLGPCGQAARPGSANGPQAHRASGRRSGRGPAQSPLPRQPRQHRGRAGLSS